MHCDEFWCMENKCFDTYFNIIFTLKNLVIFFIHSLDSVDETFYSWEGGNVVKRWFFIYERTVEATRQQSFIIFDYLVNKSSPLNLSLSLPFSNNVLLCFSVL